MVVDEVVVVGKRRRQSRRQKGLGMMYGMVVSATLCYQVMLLDGDGKPSLPIYIAGVVLASLSAVMEAKFCFCKGVKTRRVKFPPPDFVYKIIQCLF